MKKCKKDKLVKGKEIIFINWKILKCNNFYFPWIKSKDKIQSMPKLHKIVCVYYLIR